MTRLIFAFGFLFLPLAVLVLFSFNDARQLSFPLTGFTLSWYWALLDRQPVLTAFLNSFVLAQVVGAISALLGLMVAYGLSGPAAPFRRLSLVLVLSPFAIPKAVLGLAIIMMLSMAGIQRGALPLTLAHILMTLPFSTIIIGAALMRMDPRLVEAARDLGASPTRAFRAVTLPLLKPALTAAYSLAAILSMSDLTLATYLSGRFQTLAVTISSAFRIELTPDLNALQALILFVIAGFALLNLRK